MLKSHWNDYAKHWEGQSTPLRPSNSDLRSYQTAFHQAVSRGGYKSLLILGVTPEIHNLSISMGLATRALDQSLSMIKSVWPGPTGSATQGDWQTISDVVQDSSLIVCDGGLHLLDFEQQTTLIQRFKRKPLAGSTAIFRLFLPSDSRVSSSDVFHAFEKREIPNVNYLKVALWHATDIQHRGKTQIRDVWDAIHQHSGGNVTEYLMTFGQSRAAAESLLVYRDSSVAYCFQTIDAVCNLFAEQANFKVISSLIPSYEEGHRFPVVSFCYD